MIKYFFILLIDIYRYCISPYTPRSCRFYPTCSNYARESILTLGLFRGGYLAVKRILKCHPYHSGGYDPVPSINKQDI
ncbi:MAG: membrane protein insertion efficiency factor YidD [Desulfobacterales bacterium]|nr:membrane protein insertion efficiency factor YidD [Desulfobacterales bacterium]